MMVLVVVAALALRAAAEDPVLKLEGHKRDVEGLSFSADGKLLASAGQDGTVRIWDTQP